MTTIRRVPGPAQQGLLNTIRVLDTTVGKTGWFRSAKYPGGTSVAFVAAQNELGNPAKNIPPRPFIRPTITKKRTEWLKIAQQLISESINGKRNPKTIFELVASKAAAHIRNAIAELKSPALAPATIAARLYLRADTANVGGLTKPLIDTKLMYNTLTYEVTNDTRN